jgi:hypothetical protein
MAEFAMERAAARDMLGTVLGEVVESHMLETAPEVAGAPHKQAIEREQKAVIRSDVLHATAETE